MTDIIRIIRENPLRLVAEFAALVGLFTTIPFAVTLLAMATGHF